MISQRAVEALFMLVSLGSILDSIN